MEKNRYLSPKSRLADSSYKIDIKKRLPEEDLIVNVFMDDDTLYHSYHFEADQLQGRNSIHFKDEKWNIIWSPKDLKYSIVK